MPIIAIETNAVITVCKDEKYLPTSALYDVIKHAQSNKKLKLIFYIRAVVDGEHKHALVDCWDKEEKREYKALEAALKGLLQPYLVESSYEIRWYEIKDETALFEDSGILEKATTIAAVTVEPCLVAAFKECEITVFSPGRGGEIDSVDLVSLQSCFFADKDYSHAVLVVDFDEVFSATSRALDCESTQVSEIFLENFTEIYAGVKKKYNTVEVCILTARDKALEAPQGHKHYYFSVAALCEVLREKHKIDIQDKNCFFVGGERLRDSSKADFIYSKFQEKRVIFFDDQTRFLVYADCLQNCVTIQVGLRGDFSRLDADKLFALADPVVYERFKEAEDFSESESESDFEEASFQKWWESESPANQQITARPSTVSRYGLYSAPVSNANTAQAAAEAKVIADRNDSEVLELLPYTC